MNRAMLNSLAPEEDCFSLKTSFTDVLLASRDTCVFGDRGSPTRVLPGTHRRQKKFISPTSSDISAVCGTTVKRSSPRAVRGSHLGICMPRPALSRHATKNSRRFSPSLSVFSVPASGGNVTHN